MTLAGITNLIGLGLTFVGALAAAKGVMLSDDQAKELAATKWDENTELRLALTRQSKLARDGLWLVAAGTVFQGFAVVLGMA